MRLDKYLSILNALGFQVSIWQGSCDLDWQRGSWTDLCWHATGYSRARHIEFSKTHDETLACFHYHLVAHRHASMEDALGALLEYYFNPPPPAKPRRRIGLPFTSNASYKKQEPQLEDLV